MTFSEKLFKLRKERGLSQEALSEQLNTTRQAVSKWENNQGFPETEKLLMIANIFEVSIDYLLKDTEDKNIENEKGYYVSKEMAETYLLNEQKQAKNISLGISFLILATIPYLIFKETPKVAIILTIVFAMIGIGIIVSVAFVDDNKYKVLNRAALIFDQSYIKELRGLYEGIRKKYITIIVVGFCLVIAGGIPFLLVRKDFIDVAILSPYYPICICCLAVGANILIRAIASIEAYELLVKNEEFIDRLGFKLGKIFRSKINQWINI